jgi:hypothetical protein
LGILLLLVLLRLIFWAFEIRWVNGIRVGVRFGCSRVGGRRILALIDSRFRIRRLRSIGERDTRCGRDGRANA